MPGPIPSPPDPGRPQGTDLLPQLSTFVIMMKENHSYDNYFGMFERGDGFARGPDGQPTNANPDAQGHPVTVHHLPVPFNPSFDLSQTWDASHRQWHNGAMDGFVTTSGSAEPMGYFDEADLPWYYSFARAFGIGDRYFSSVLAQTFPNRRFLQAATAYGLVSTSIPSPLIHPPPTGLIWDRLDAHGISWANYFVELPEVALWPRNLLRYHDHLHDIDRFHEDARGGRLPAVALITPGFAVASEGEYQDDQIGEKFTAEIFGAVSGGPQWDRTFFVVVWDEGGGFYDHVPPPAAVPPDDIPPAIKVPPDEPGGYDRLGFRVPSLVASPYSRPGYVSSVVYDHTSILATLEYKWNLAPLTRRDAAANPLLDFVDLKSPPGFLTVPTLAQPALWPFTGSR